MFNKSNANYCLRVRNIYFDNDKHGIYQGIEETNTETFMGRSVSATIAYIEIHMIRKQLTI